MMLVNSFNTVQKFLATANILSFYELWNIDVGLAYENLNMQYVNRIYRASAFKQNIILF